MMAHHKKANVFLTHAAAFESFVDGIAVSELQDLPRLSGELEQRLHLFEQRCVADGQPPVQVRPARLALGVLADQAIRTQPAVDLKVWSSLARQALFDGRDMSTTEVRGFTEIANSQGEDFARLAEFLDHCLNRMTARRGATIQTTRSRPGLALLIVLVVLVTGLAGYVSFLETRFHRQAMAAFTAFQDDLSLDRISQSSDLVVALNRLSGDIVHVRAAMRDAPLRGWITLPFANAERDAQLQYQQAAAQVATPLLADAIGLALATEGQGLALYDTIRADGILRGQTPWEPEFLAGWVAARESNFGLQGFAAHVGLIPGPASDLPAPDPLIMDQARQFAAETNEADRAWLEMLRSVDVGRLPVWKAEDEIPSLGQVALRRSGAPLEVPGIYTTQGWAMSRQTAAGVAVQKTRQLAQALFGTTLPQQNDTPDLVLARLQTETIAYWQAWLADLRVRPFDVPQTAIIVSGTLAQPSSPLPQLLEQVWAQVGGPDRTRPRPQQLEIARAFGPMIQYVEQGRMEEIGALFAAVNVALSTRDLDAARGDRAIVSAAGRARSIQSLRAAPRVVALLVEDTLAQISSAGSTGDTPQARAWAQVYGICQQALAGRYPFAAGPDVSMAAMEQMLGRTGAIPLFFRQFGAPNMDMDTSPWRWKTEARFAGLTPETAVFFEHTMTINTALFGGGELAADFSVAALAERGRATLQLGGAEVPLRADAAPAALSWPGSAPDQGVSLRFEGGDVNDTLTRNGSWGLLRLLDGLRVRPRDDNQRFLVDMRDTSGRVFVEMIFETALNPVSVRPLLDGFACPDHL